MRMIPESPSGYQEHGVISGASVTTETCFFFSSFLFVFFFTDNTNYPRCCCCRKQYFYHRKESELHVWSHKANIYRSKSKDMRNDREEKKPLHMIATTHTLLCLFQWRVCCMACWEALRCGPPHCKTALHPHQNISGKSKQWRHRLRENSSSSVRWATHRFWNDSPSWHRSSDSGHSDEDATIAIKSQSLTTLLPVFHQLLSRFFFFFFTPRSRI